MSISQELESTLNLINPVSDISSFEELQRVANNNTVYSLIQQKFFVALPPLMESKNLQQVPGDFVAVGIWKGGSALFLKALLRHFRLDKQLFLIDTFNGFDINKIKHEKDLEALKLFSNLSIEQMPTKKDVELLFNKGGYLLDDSITIIEEGIEDIHEAMLPDSISLIHIDVDFYEPTYAAIEKLYPKLNKGGIIIIDDYGVPNFNCKEAIDSYRKANNIEQPIYMITNFIAYWVK